MKIIVSEGELIRFSHSARPAIYNMLRIIFTHLRRTIFHPCLWIWLPIFLFAANGLWAEESDRAIDLVSVDVGFEGKFKTGLWTPLSFRLRGKSKEALKGTVELQIPDGDGTVGRLVPLSGSKVSISSEEALEVPFLVRFGRNRAECTLIWTSENGQQITWELDSEAKPSQPSLTVGIPSSHEFILALGPDVGMQKTVNGWARERGFRWQLAQIDSIEKISHLPTHWLGYEGVDRVFMATSPAEFAQALGEDQPRKEALLHWVEMGGRLVLSVGQEAPKFFGEGGLWERLAPGKFSRMEELVLTRGWETFCEATKPVSGSRRRGFQYSVPVWENARGRTLNFEGKTPTVQHYSLGMGEVLCVGIDLAGEPWGDWEENSLLHGRILVPFAPVRTGSGGRSSPDEARGQRGISLGINDLAGQLRGALDQFDGVWVVPFWLVGALVVLYWIFLVPIDYLFLGGKKFRGGWSWLSTSVLIVLAGGGAVWLGYRHKGSHLKLNVAEMIQIDTSTLHARGTSWFTLYSPQTETYSLAVEPRLPGQSDSNSSQSWIGWMGLPGSALGGMEPSTSSPRLFRKSYDFSPELNRLENVPVPVWSTKSFTAGWETQLTNKPVESDLRSSFDKVPEGSFTSRLPFDLHEVMLIGDRWAFVFPKLEAGKSLSVRAGEQRDLQAVLKNLQLVQSGKDKTYSQKIPLYDQAGQDIPTILRNMLFYQATNGYQYTGLYNNYQGFVDLSHMRYIDRALLIGLAPEEEAYSAIHLKAGDSEPDKVQQRRWTMFCFLLPVDILKSGSESATKGTTSSLSPP